MNIVVESINPNTKNFIFSLFANVYFAEFSENLAKIEFIVGDRKYKKEIENYTSYTIIENN